jgi:AraC-like DNA-binding protein
MRRIGEFSAQEDGGLPTMSAAGSTPGDNGVSIFNVRFQSGVHFSATQRPHLNWFQLSEPHVEYSSGSRRVRRDAPVASAFVNGLVACHTSEPESRTRGVLSKDVLDHLRSYVIAHLDEAVEVSALAKLAGRSLFHFTRVFSRSVGMTPHRYVVHLRLQRAIELVRDGRFGLAEIAARTGVADQSHMSRWVRRVHGVSVTQLAARPRFEQRGPSRSVGPDSLNCGKRCAEPSRSSIRPGEAGR